MPGGRNVRNRATGARSRAIDENYVSPHTRFALLLDDHPEADHHFGWASADELGIPPSWAQGYSEFVTCTIEIPGHKPVVRWKEIADDEDRNPEELVKAQAKALGRAARAAGYPDRMQDLRAMVLWRQRKAEAALGGGSAVTPDALPAGTSPAGGPPPAGQLAAGGPDPDERWTDPDDEVAEAELDDVVDQRTGEAEKPADGTMATLAQVLNDTAKAKVQDQLKAFCNERGYSMIRPKTELEAREVIQCGWDILEQPFEDGYGG